MSKQTTKRLTLKTLACCATLQSDVTIEADIDEDDAVLVNELQPVNLRAWIIFRPQILHPAHTRYDTRLDLAQRFYFSGRHILTCIILFAATRIGGKGSEQRNCGQPCEN